jgi:hypothetical protein
MVPGSFIDGRPMKPFSTLWMDPALLKVPTRVVSMMSPKNSVLKDLSELAGLFNLLVHIRLH